MFAARAGETSTLLADSLPPKTRRIWCRFQIENMEILIVGVILVGLMVYVSTRIKKSAASAFEQEIIESEDFRLIKPEGFISPIKENSDFVFEAYTKDFGKNDAEEFRQAWANLVVISDSSFEIAVENVKKSNREILSEKTLKDAPEEQKICLVDGEKAEKNVTVKTFYKVIESSRHRKIYQLQISVLDAYRENYADRINNMLKSFAVK